MELGIDLVNDFTEIFLICLKINVINIDDQHLTQCIMSWPKPHSADSTD